MLERYLIIFDTSVYDPKDSCQVIYMAKSCAGIVQNAIQIICEQHGYSDSEHYHPGTSSLVANNMGLMTRNTTIFEHPIVIGISELHYRLQIIT